MHNINIELRKSIIKIIYAEVNVVPGFWRGCKVRAGNNIILNLPAGTCYPPNTQLEVDNSGSQKSVQQCACATDRCEDNPTVQDLCQHEYHSASTTSAPTTTTKSGTYTNLQKFISVI